MIINKLGFSVTALNYTNDNKMFTFILHHNTTQNMRSFYNKDIL